MSGYRLRFSHRGLVFTEPAFANLEVDPEGSVHGVLHHLDPQDWARLERFEGAEYVHVELRVEGEVSGAVLARAYLDPSPVEGRRPSLRYLRSCCAGAREHGLPEDYVRALEAQDAWHVPGVSHVSDLLVGVAEALRYAGLRPERLRMRPGQGRG